MTSQMAIMHDSEGYQKLGYLLQEDGFLAYFKTGPRREPLYPLFISWCISLSKILNVSYKSILIIGQFLILGITQWLMQKVLQLFQIDKRIQAGVLIYFGLSAAMITSALRLYSEIVTYPFIVLAVLLSCRLLGVIIQENNTLKKTILLSVAVGLNFFVLTMMKVAFQAIVPLYGLLLILCFVPLLRNKN
ncbi:MAG: hypothetical protein KC684_06600, partial [Candidatus Omnitrophica bacterium]|nr:hypothetical protein [Candidatus Omnitrophota bacterium]